MTNPIAETKQSVAQLLDAALERAVEAGALPASNELPDFVVEIPADTSHGDFASNIAMACARPFKSAPRKIAEAICQHLDLSGSPFDRTEIAGPGFINFFLKDAWFADVVAAVLREGDSCLLYTSDAADEL